MTTGRINQVTTLYAKVTPGTSKLPTRVDNNRNENKIRTAVEASGQYSVLPQHDKSKGNNKININLTSSSPHRDKVDCMQDTKYRSQQLTKTH